jgi:serine/threonine protein kinase
MHQLDKEFSAEELERFRREALYVARLTHPNIPAIYDVDLRTNHFAIFFQFIEGKNLRQLIKENGKCSFSQVGGWFLQIASALTHAHEMKLIHRDIKPENIIVTPDQKSVYLVDFGIAISADESKKLTQKGFVIGTEPYMSPEQRAGKEVDWRTDIYSLGMTLYEALSGQMVEAGNYEELSSLDETIPPDIDELVRECLLEKTKRVQSATSFADRLVGANTLRRPLADVLTHGRLHELALAIEDMNADDFSQLPESQRALILLKLEDIVQSGERNLRFACEQFIVLLLHRANKMSADEYEQLVSPAIEWGFEIEFEGTVGREQIRRAIAATASAASETGHPILAERFVNFCAGLDFESKEDWFLHSLREVSQSLLANPFCRAHTTKLADVLRNVNRIQRTRRKESSRHPDSAPLMVRPSDIV